MSNTPQQSSPSFETIVIVGVGLIGGSIAAAVGRRKLAKQIIGVGRHQSRLDQMRKLKLIDAATRDLAQAASQADLMIFCTPVDRIVEGVRHAATHCRAGTLITDTGSVKGIICAQLAEKPTDAVPFVGSHPLAGSEKQGFEFADADLFDGRICVVTPHDHTPDHVVARVSDFWRQLGLAVVKLSPTTHDVILAQTSHLPHLAAAALATLLTDENRDLTAGGFRDMTRIAAGDEDLWTAILMSNVEAVLAGLDRYEETLQKFRTILEQRDAHSLRSILREAKAKRDSL